MCVFKVFYHLCGCAVFQIENPCADASVNVQGDAFCPHDPHPHMEDGRTRPGGLTLTHGPGVCSSLACQWEHGIRKPGDFDSERGSEGDAEPRQDLAVFDMSAEARQEREDRWYRLLSLDEQLESLSTQFPVAAHELSDYTRAFMNPHMPVDTVGLGLFGSADPTQVVWQELNPKYMAAGELQWATGRFLPASVTAPGQESTPHQPRLGPFAVGAHRCPRRGRCELCGRFRRKGAMPGPVAPVLRQHRTLDAIVSNGDTQRESPEEQEWDQVLKQVSEESVAGEATGDGAEAVEAVLGDLAAVNSADEDVEMMDGELDFEIDYN